MKLAAIEMGHGAGIPVVLLHGFGGVAAVWGRVQAALAEKHPTIAFDLPGHGGSLRYPDALTARTFANAVLTEMDRRQIGKAHIIGHSMGGATAALMAIAAPERVASLTLLAPGGFGPQINASLIERYALAVEPAELGACLAAMIKSGLTSDHPVSLLSTMRQREGQSEALVLIAARMLREGQQGTIPRERLKELSMPVAVLWGRYDNMVPVSQAVGLPEHFRVTILDGVGHMLADEQPSTVIDFIERNIV